MRKRCVCRYAKFETDVEHSTKYSKNYDKPKKLILDQLRNCEITVVDTATCRRNLVKASGENTNASSGPASAKES